MFLRFLAVVKVGEGRTERIRAPKSWCIQALVLLLGLGMIGCARGIDVHCDSSDCTDVIQHALNDTSSDEVVLFGQMPTQPLFIRNRTSLSVYFMPSATLFAKRGAYKGLHDMVLRIEESRDISIIGNEGAEIWMWQQDYNNQSHYNTSQWRHCFAVYSSQNVTIKSLVLRNSGGDGMYVDGLDGGMVENVVMTENWRNAMSVIRASDTVWVNCTFANTTGTAPRAGIDFEPNSDHDYLRNLVIEDSIATGNGGNGFGVSVSALTNVSSPISITFTRCLTQDSYVGPGFAVLSFRHGSLEAQVRGTVVYQDGTIFHSKNPGISLASPPSIKVSILNTTINSTAYAHQYWSPVSVTEARYDSSRTWMPGGLYMDASSTIEDQIPSSNTTQRPYLSVCESCANVQLDNTSVIPRKGKKCVATVGPNPLERNISISIQCIP